MSAPVRVATLQLAPVLGDVEGNRRRLLAAVAAAAQAGARVVVAPELATTGYVFRTADEAAVYAEEPDGPTVRALHAAAARHDVVLVVGLLLTEAGTLRNSAVVVDAEGLRATYHKAHLWGREPEIFAAGEAAPPVVETKHGRIGVVICYDLEFPEWVRRAALDGAEILCAPVNWPDPGRPDGERPVEVITAQVAAATNRVYVAVADRAGDERGTSWIGGSLVADPDGYPVAMTALDGRPTTLLADCDLAAARDKSVAAYNDRFADRRPQLYG